MHNASEAFALLDADGSGALDAAEVYRALDLLGMVPSSQTT